MPYHARLGDRCRDVRHAAQHVALAYDGANALDRIDTVLEGNDRTAAGDQRLDRLRRDLGIPKLDREQHDIEASKRSRIIARDGLREAHVAAAALHDESALANRRKVPAAGDERHVVAGERKLRAEVAADAAGGHDRNTHDQ